MDLRRDAAVAEAENALKGLFSTREHRNDPWPLYKTLQRACPVHRSSLLHAWVVSRLADVRKVLTSQHTEIRNIETRLAADWRDHPSARNMAEYLVLRDDPSHREIRKVLAPEWQQEFIERYRPQIRQIASELADAFVAKGGGNFLNEVAYQLPVRAISLILGVPLDAELDWQQLSAELNLCHEPDCTMDEMRCADSAAVTIREFFTAKAEERRRSPGDDMFSQLVTGKALDHHTGVAMAESLFIGGFETTTQAIANGMWTLIQHPAEVHRLRTHPANRKFLTDEILRYCPPIMLSLRTATRPLALSDGSIVAPGERVIACIASANRDPSVFQDPDAFRVEERPRGASFGYGVHVCLGMWLARMEIDEIFDAMLNRSREISFVGAPPRFRERLSLRGPVELLLDVA